MGSFWWICPPLGGSFGAKTGSSGHPEFPKLFILAPLSPQEAHQEPPKRSQESNRSSKNPQEPPKAPQEAPQEPQEAPQSPPRAPKSPLSVSNLSSQADPPTLGIPYSPTHAMDSWQRGGFREAYGDPPRCSTPWSASRRFRSRPLLSQAQAVACKDVT